MAVQRVRPYVQFNFVAEIDGIGDAGFSEVSGLDARVDVIEYRAGNAAGNESQLLPGRVHYGPVTLRRGLAGSTALWQWFELVRNGDPNSRRAVAIRLRDEQHQDVMVWTLHHAWPMKYESGPFNARGTDVAIEELVLACERIEAE